MPLPLLIALVLAFGLDTIDETGSFTSGELERRVAQVGGGLILVAALACVFGIFVARFAGQRGGSSRATRRLQGWGGGALEILALGYFAWVIHWVDWVRVVEWGLGLRQAIVLDEFLIILPYLLAQLAVWWGLYPGERALRAGRFGTDRMVSRSRHLILKARMTYGLVLPVALIYTLTRDLITRYDPRLASDPWAEVGGIALLGALIPVMAPALARLSWPSRPLGPGPLRDRLERLAHRFGFRCTEILVWDTGGAVINAGVTGSLPWFRYVLLSDALIKLLDDHEIEAVFGHEVGHVAHRHLPYFGFFFLGSLGVMALAAHLVKLAASAVLGPDTGELITAVVEISAVLVCLAVYFLGFFGFLSRRFERQADVFGCRAVSCGRAQCPPHADLNAHETAVPESSNLCPVGIRIFSNALSRVEQLNGPPEGPLSRLFTWRHGRVSRRLAFLNTLDGHPEAERRFQSGIARLRLVVALMLVAALVAAVATHSLRYLAG
ncbi:MAG: M48 family metallopeptidase [Isosphaeraceae bacterium]